MQAYRSNPHNPNIKLSRYIPYNRFGIPHGVNTTAQTPFEYWNASEHFDWLLYECDRKTPVSWGDSATAKQLAVVDMSNPEVIEHQLKLYGQSTADQGYDGLACDNVHLTNVRNQCGVWRKGKSPNSREWVQLYTPSRSHRDDAWASAVVTWAQKLGAGLSKIRSKAGRPLDMVPNFSVESSGGWDDPHTLALMNATAGSLSEEGFLASVLNSRKLPEDAWVQTVRFLSNLNRHGKPLYAICEWGGPRSVGKQAITSDIREWVAATFLMGRLGEAANRSGVALVNTLGYGTWDDWPEFQADVGGAVDADARIVGGVWLRQFERALALVNPGNLSRSATIPAPPAGSEFRNVSTGGAVAAGLHKLPPQTAMLLLRRSKTDDRTLDDAFRLIEAQGRQIAQLQAQLSSVAPPPAPGLFVVTDFGADPTGNRDSTQAIQQAFWNATTQMARDGVFEFGSDFEPEVRFPAGHYKVSDTINLSNVKPSDLKAKDCGNVAGSTTWCYFALLRVTGEGKATVEQTRLERDVFAGSIVERLTFEFMSLKGGRHQLHVVRELHFVDMFACNDLTC